MMVDIALGMQEVGLQAFAATVNAAWVDEWKNLGLYDENEESWGRAFEQALTRTLAAGGRFHFDLTGLDIADAINGDPERWVDRHTAWELQQIVGKVAWFDNTIFYLNGVRQTSTEVGQLGIRAPTSEKAE